MSEAKSFTIETVFGQLSFNVGDTLFLPAYESIEFVKVEGVSPTNGHLMCLFKDKGKDGGRLEYISEKSMLAKQFWSAQVPPEGFEAPVKLAAFGQGATNDPDNMAFMLTLQRPDVDGRPKTTVSMTGRTRNLGDALYGRIHVTVKDGKLHKVVIVE